MKLVFSIVTGYVILYAVIWMHEVGHALFDTIYGCKDNPFHVSVKPYLYGSTPGKVDYERLSKLAPRKILVMSYAGIAINLIFGTLMLILIQYIHPTNYYISLLMYQFMTLHYAEAVTYLFFSNIILSSDMLQIAVIQPKLRWVNLCFGVVALAAYILLLTRIPAMLYAAVYVWNAITIICMRGGRIAFTLANKNKGAA